MLQLDTTAVHAQTRIDFLRDQITKLMDNGTQTPSTTYICVVCSREDEQFAVIRGYVESATCGATRWQRWLPMFQWAPIEGGLRADEGFQECLANTMGKFTILHTTGQSRPAAAKRVSKYKAMC
jgi:hypothetical protein